MSHLIHTVLSAAIVLCGFHHAVAGGNESDKALHVSIVPLETGWFFKKTDGTAAVSMTKDYNPCGQAISDLPFDNLSSFKSGLKWRSIKAASLSAGHLRCRRPSGVQRCPCVTETNSGVVRPRDRNHLRATATKSPC